MFQGVWSDLEDLPKSAMFKTVPGGQFPPLANIHPKSTQTFPEGVRNPFSSVQESFQEVLSDLEDLPKYAMFQTMAYSPGFLLKIGQFPTLANSPEIDTNSPGSS